MTDTKSKDDVSLSVDPFSEDHEITMMEKMSVSLDIDTLDETNEVTEKSFVNQSPAAVSHQATASKRNIAAKPTSAPSSAEISPQLKRTALIVTVPVALVLFFGILYLFNVLLPQWTKPSKPPIDIKANLTKELPLELFGPQDHNIQLSELTVEGEEDLDGNLPSVYIGDALRLHFSLINWQIPPKKPILNFRVAVKIFDATGKTILSLPNYKEYSNHALAKEESLLIENEIHVLPSTAVGVYDVRFDVIDSSSQKSKTLQTRFRVLSRQPANR